jgi:tetratricopeptide (TPR) repeat protein
MKKIFLAIALISSLTTFSQTAIEWYNKGNEKLNANDYAGSVKDYDKALMLDPKFVDAYYNRGTSKIYLKNYTGAIDDYTKAIGLKPDFVSAYLNRANAKLSLNDSKGALIDLDAIIKLDPAHAVAYLMRGQVKLNQDDMTGGCADLNKAKALGDTRAENILQKFCAATTGREKLKLDWPASENWKIASDQENDQQHMVELVKSNETLKNWAEIGTMTAVKGIVVPVDKVMNMLFEQTREKAPDSKLTVIEKDEKAEYPWIMFTIESPRFTDDSVPESQLWYVIQGKQALYTNFRAIKKATISPDLKEKWSKFFKSGKIVVE